MLSVISTGSELRRFGRGRLPRLAVVAMILVPLLYGALYLWAFWDPTGNLDKLPVALVNADSGATLDGTAEHAGSDVVARLTAAKNLDWHVTDAAHAASGVRDGAYYFAVTIPPTFSADLVSAAGADPTAATIQVTYNDANSFLATTLGRTAMLQVEQAVSAAAGEQAVSKVLVGLGSARDGFATASDGALTLKAAAGDLASGAHQVAAGASSAASGAGTLASGAQALLAGAESAATGSSSVASGATGLASGAARVAGGASQVASGAASLASGAGSLKAGTAQVASGASQLASSVADAVPGADQLKTGAAAVSSGVDSAVSQVTAMSTKLSSLSSVAAYLTAEAYNPDGSIKDPAAAQQLGTLAAALPSASDSAAMTQQLAALQTGAHQVAAGAATLDGGMAQLATASGQLSAGATSAASGAATLADGASALSSGASTVATGAATAATGAAELANGSSTLASGVAQLNQGASALAGGAQTLAHGTATLADGAAAVATGAGQVTDGTGKLSSALATGAAAIPASDAAQQTARATTIATPVTLADTDLAKAQGFGEGFAPFFIPLALFVGSLITWLLLRPLPSRALAAAVPGWRTTIAGFLPALLLGLAQVAVMLGVIHYGVGLHLTNAAGTVAFTVLVVATFLALQQMLIALLGPAAGKVTILALLMLQLASSGGTYPVDTTPAFFRAVHPWMPMSYAVTGLRMLITGGADGRLVVSVLVLVGTLVASLTVSSWRAGRMRTWTLSRLHPALSI